MYTEKKTKMDKYVYSFNEGNESMWEELGRKGSNLAVMTKLGLPVPFGFTIGTSCFRQYFENGQVMPKDAVAQILEKMAELEEVIGKRFGDPQDPLLLSVRSGAPLSMPGMMDTVLNVGLNDESVQGLARTSRNERFALDSYRRFIEVFSDVALGVPRQEFQDIFETFKQRRGFATDQELDAPALRAIVTNFKNLVLAKTGKRFPQDPHEQLMMAVEGVFASWNSDNAKHFRHMNNISADIGTAVNVQRMVFGNRGENSCTGVAFSRSPMDGEKHIFGEFMINAQGNDIVAGIRTPREIREMRTIFPDIYEQLRDIAILLERYFGDIQDIEFTVEEGELYILQTRSALRTAQAAVSAAVDMENDGLIDRETAIRRIRAYQLIQLMHPRFDKGQLKKAMELTRGVAASPGAASGHIYFDVEDLIRASETGGKGILVRQTASLEDLAGVVEAEGILTQQGGKTSHAAVVARALGKSCICGCTDMRINEEEKTVTLGDVTLKEGDYISMDGATGRVYAGEIETHTPRIAGDFLTIMKWADGVRTMGVRANADTPREVRRALAFGAEGIGLCRTEHMFLDGPRINGMRRVILADTEKERREALAELLPYQTQDFKDIFTIMGGRPVAIRLLDPPLNELMPQNMREIAIMSDLFEIPYDDLARKVRTFQETNPMLGYRGARLLIAIPEITEMQVRAILRAAIDAERELNVPIVPEIMVPLVSTEKELQHICRTIERTAETVFLERNYTVEYKVGIMIETPRAAMLADQLAPYVDFFSFGTNDLTQLAMGLSRDDSGRIIDAYKKADVFDVDPFTTIDEEGVGALIETSIRLAREVKPNIRFGICGEHGGDPRSVNYFHKLDLDYVSCSPYSLPLARLTSAQATIRNRK